MTLLSSIKRQLGQLKKNTQNSQDAENIYNDFSSEESISDEVEDLYDEEMLRPTYQYAQTVVKLHQQPVLHENTDVLQKSEQHNDQKSNYTHGLEKIYSLENIDPKSIKPLGEVKIDRLHSRGIEDNNTVTDGQYLFDFNGSCRNWLQPFLYAEPIQVLGLSQHTEKSLYDNQLLTLESLIDVDLRSLVFLKGFGQGHIDEIKTKLAAYLDGRSLKKMHHIDFPSWLKTIIGAYDRKKIYLCLQEYELHEFITLSPAENAEIKRLTNEKRQQWLIEALQLCSESQTIISIKEKMAECVEVFIKPWVSLRNGICYLYELEERLLQISSTPAFAEKILAFFKVLTGDALCGIEHYLVKVDEDVYCSDNNTAKHFHLIVNTALSYFYKPNLSYSLFQLLHWLQKEFAKQWIDIADDFIIKTLKASSLFIIARSDDGLLYIRA